MPIYEMKSKPTGRYEYQRLEIAINHLPGEGFVLIESETLRHIHHKGIIAIEDENTT